MARFDVTVYKVVGEIRTFVYAKDEMEAKKRATLEVKDRPFVESNCTGFVIASPKEETQKIMLVPVMEES